MVAVEIKLIGELQELYGQPVAGGHAQRAISLLQAWAGRRGVSLMVPGRGAAAVLGTAARHELRDRLVRRFGRNLTTLGPIFTGAAVAACLNRRATVHLAEEVRKDLAKRLPPAITQAVRPGAAVQRVGQPVRVAGADEPVRRRVGRVVEVDADAAGDPRALDDERQRVGVAAEQVPALLRAERPGGGDGGQRQAGVVHAQTGPSASSSTRIRIRPSASRPAAARPHTTT